MAYIVPYWGQVMTKSEAEAVLLRVCMNELELGLTAHFWERARMRLPGFGRQHAYAMIRSGRVRGKPVKHETHHNHTVKV